MANKRWDLCSPVPYVQNGQEKTKWLKLGVMFENKAGTGFNILLDAVPIPRDEQIKIMAFEPKDDWGTKKKSSVDDDEITF